MNNTRITMKNSHPAAARRAGMHHAAEFAFRRSRLTETSSEIDLPAALAASMPSAEEDDDLIIASIAEEEVEIIAEDTAAEAAEAEALENGITAAEGSEAETVFWEPVTGGEDCEPRIVVYDPGDGIPRAIPDPLGVLGN